jgi:hypothetical protein
MIRVYGARGITDDPADPNLGFSRCLLTVRHSVPLLAAVVVYLVLVEITRSSS